MFYQAIKKGKLVVDAGLIEGFVPPAALSWGLKAGLPKAIWNLRGCLKKLNLIGVQVHVRATTRPTPIKIKQTPTQRTLVTFSPRRHRDMSVVEIRLTLLIAYAAPTSRNSKALL